MTNTTNAASVAETQAFEAWFKQDCPVSGVNAKLGAKAAWIARAALAAQPQAAQTPQPIAPDVAAELERSDWTPEEALRWYAAGRHYDTVPNGDGTSSARILDNGAVASNALKAISRQYAELKGDVALLEAPQATQEPMFWVRLCRDGLYEGPVHHKSVGGKMLRDEKPDAWTPLYTHPARKPLPPMTAIKLVLGVSKNRDIVPGTTNWALAVVRDIEAAHGIKGDEA